MVARITTPASMQETLNYNEHKVRRGVATCIAENQFPAPVNRLNFYEKLRWLQERNERNSRAATKTLHVSLNFAPSESLTDEQMAEIAADYMQRMGLAEQPYLVYRHHDAGHPHLHILATLIREDGSRIATHNIARDRSEPARKAIQEKYDLVHAENPKIANDIPMTQPVKVVYSKSETRRSIASVLNNVLPRYNYTSLPELNAVLKGFGVVADRGSKESFTYRNRGLLYRLLDGNGVPTGLPIRASTLPGKPILSALEKRFDQNRYDRELPRLALQITLDKSLAAKPGTLEGLIALLEREKITTVLRQNAEGRIYGITFIDHRNRSVFNGSQIGKPYSITGLYQQLGRQPTQQQHRHTAEEPPTPYSLLEKLLQPENEQTDTPRELDPKRKKKKRKL